MAKNVKILVDVTKPIPEWGLSDTVSTAVPISLSGAEVKSTREISSTIHNMLRSRLGDKLAGAKGLIVRAKRQKPSNVVFQASRGSRRVFVARKKK